MMSIEANNYYDIGKIYDGELIVSRDESSMSTVRRNDGRIQKCYYEFFDMQPIFFAKSESASLDKPSHRNIRVSGIFPLERGSS